MTTTDTSPFAITVPAVPSLVEAFGDHPHFGDGEGFDAVQAAIELRRDDAVEELLGTDKCATAPVMPLMLRHRGVLVCAA